MLGCIVPSRADSIHPTDRRIADLKGREQTQRRLQRITGAIGAYLIYEAQRLGIPRSAVVRMVANIAVDTAIGAIPFAGDIWDFFFRANDRNMQILARHIGGLPVDLPYEDAAKRR